VPNKLRWAREVDQKNRPWPVSSNDEESRLLFCHNATARRTDLCFAQLLHMYHDCSTMQNDLAWKVLNLLVDLQVTVLEYELPAFVHRLKRQKQNFQSRDCGFMKNDSTGVLWMHGAVRWLGTLYNEMCSRWRGSSKAVARKEAALTCTAINYLLMKAYLQYKQAINLRMICNIWSQTTVSCSKRIGGLTCPWT